MPKHSFARDVWSLILPYWQSEERWIARGLLAVIVALNLGLVYLNVLFNDWNGAFYNALQDKDWDAFTEQLFRFSWLAALFIIVAVYQLYLNQMLQIRWRRWLVDKFTADWLRHRGYYRLQLGDYGTDNPDQRIAEDTRMFVTDTLSLALGLMRSVVTLVSFLGILWTLSGAITLLGIEIPGYMVWVAILYAVIGTYITHLVGRPLIQLNNDQQRFEADFRFGLIRLRENAEAVALYAGEATETKGFQRSFTAIWTNWWRIMTRQKHLTFLTAGYDQIAVIFPILVGAPRYFNGAIQLGGLMQISSAFGQVQSALSWVIDAYVRLTEWRATVDRLRGFRHAIDTIEREHADAEASGRTIRRSSGGELIRVQGLEIRLPDGRPLLLPADFDLPAGARILLRGPSGSGKSTLFRALAGIWPWGSGAVQVPQTARLLFLPQKPYLPIGSLRAALTYPAGADAFDTSLIAQAMRDCRLEHLIDRLDDERNWQQTLSPGEQQRLSAVRALLLRPDWLFLDEATSALDDETEDRLYRLFREQLPATSLVSIAHRPAVAQFHDRTLTLVPQGDGTVRLT